MPADGADLVRRAGGGADRVVRSDGCGAMGDGCGARNDGSRGCERGVGSIAPGADPARPLEGSGPLGSGIVTCGTDKGADGPN